MVVSETGAVAMSAENTEMSTIYAAKRALRKTMQQRLRDIPPDSIRQQCEHDSLEHISV